MPLRLYMDVHVPRAVTVGLRARGVDVLTAVEDASALGRVLFTSDRDFFRVAAEFQADATPFEGVVYTHATTAIGTCVEGLYLMAEALDESEVRGRIVPMIR